MAETAALEYRRGRTFLGRLPGGKDLIQTLEEFCRQNTVQTAVFSVFGAASTITLGTFDQKQQVYITHSEAGYFEIVNCRGNISERNGKPFVYAHITLADENGHLTGGRLFSDTVIYSGEMVLQELNGKPLERDYDETTGMLAWKIAPF